MSPLNSITFNQDFTCIAISSQNNYKIFNVDPFGECFAKEDDGGANLVQMLFSTSLISIVGNGTKPTNSSRRLKILNIKKNTIICELTFPSVILNIRLNRKRLVVILIDQIYIYDISCIKLLHVLETNSNTLKSGDLSCNDESILCLPYSLINDTTSLGGDLDVEDLKDARDGSILLYDCIDLKPISLIKAHKTPIQNLKLSNDGSLLATASVKGTIIRIFDTKSGKRLINLRRGNSLSKINCLSFNLDNTIIGVSSNHDTIHFFKLTGERDNELEQDNYPRSRSVSKSSTLSEDGYISDHSISSLNENLENLLNPPNQNNEASGDTRSQRKYSLNNLKKNLPSVINYLPYNNYITNIWEPHRSFAYLKLPSMNHGLTNTTASVEIESIIGFDANNSIVMIGTNDGWFYVYSLSADGGECLLLKQYCLLEA